MTLRILAVLAVFLLLAGCSAGPREGQDAAQGHEGEITTGFLEAYARQIEQSEHHPGPVEPDNVVAHVANMQALIAEGRARGITDLPQFRQAVHQFKANLLLETMQADMVPDISRDDITDEEARKYFEAHEQVYRLPDLYRVSMIHAADEQKIRGLLSRIQDEASLMQELTAEMPEVTVQEMDPRPLNRIPEKYREALQDMKPGDVSRVMRRDDQYLVLRLEEVSRNRVQDFDERKEYIRNDVLYSRYRQAWQEAYAELREKHKIAIDDAVAEDFAASFRENGGSKP